MAPFGTYLPIETWRAQARTKDLPADAWTRLYTPPAPQDLETTDKGVTRLKSVGDRRYRFCMSRGTPDRGGDVVNQLGFDLTNFRDNPVAPWSHSYHALPVGTWPVVTVSATETVGELQFVAVGINPEVDMIEKYVAAGIVRGASVGIRVIEWSYDERRGGYNLDQNELLECSLCVIPMHPGALALAKAMSLDLAPLRKAAEEILDGVEPGGIWMPKDVAANAFRLLSASSASVAVVAANPAQAEPAAEPKTFNPLEMITRDRLKGLIIAGVAETVHARINRAVGRLD